MQLKGSIEKLTKISEDIKWNNKLHTISLFCYPILIGFFLRPKIEKRLQELHQLRNDIFSQISTQFSIFNEYNQNTLHYLKFHESYLVHPKKIEILSDLKNNLESLKLAFNHRNFLPKNLVDQILPLKTEILTVNEEIVNFNEYFIQKRMNDYHPLFLKSPYPLDENQKRAVIIDDCHNLIVAGAGSGKTEVIINRIAYLTERKPDTVNPERILVLAYQNKAAHEIQERLAERYNINVKIKTFHALGKEICEHASQYLKKEIPRLKFTGDNADYQYSKFISEMVRKSRDDPVFEQLLWNFLFSYGYASVEKSETDFTDLQDYYNYVRNLQYTTLSGIKVKSKAECEIFNFYFSHRVNGKPISIEYESPAKWMMYLDEEGMEKIPHPDFFLPGFDIYHEHWAIDKNRNVPPWFSGEDPKREYIEGMEKKKQKFKIQDRYLLIETSSADYSNVFESVLIKRFENALEKKYPSSEITIEKIPYIELIGKVWEECRASTNRLDGHIANFISIAKTYALDPDAIEQRIYSNPWSGRQIAFANMALYIYRKYEESLRSGNTIDFSDMINLAIKELEHNPEFYTDQFDQILIDEYQDISQQRYLLIKALMQKSRFCKVFCVGDDWQSIMGFAGSNLDLFVHFSDYFSHPHRTDLSMNYRSGKGIVEAGQAIIRHNNHQIQKETCSFDQHKIPVKVVRFHSFADRDYGSRMAHYCVDLVEKYLKEGIDPDDIFILSRITKGYNIQTTLLTYAQEQNVPITTESRRSNSVQLMSIHKSKGLQARIVIVLNVDSSLYGLPCQLENPDIYQPAIDGRVRGHLEEERRLFYVAITRAKEQAVLFTWDKTMSIFIDEISPFIEYQDVF